jgi:hypothetical protein
MRAVMRKEPQSEFLFNAMTTEEYTKAKEFYEFLKRISECNHGFLNISRKELIDIATTIMKCTPYEAHLILRKMKQYGWIKEINDDLVVINIG